MVRIAAGASVPLAPGLPNCSVRLLARRQHLLLLVRRLLLSHLLALLLLKPQLLGLPLLSAQLPSLLLLTVSLLIPPQLPEHLLVPLSLCRLFFLTLQLLGLPMLFLQLFSLLLLAVSLLNLVLFDGAFDQSASDAQPVGVQSVSGGLPVARLTFQVAFLFPVAGAAVLPVFVCPVR